MKLWNYVFLSVTIAIVLEMAGIPTGLSGIFDLIGFSFEGGASEMTDAQIWTSILGSAGILIALVGTVGFVIAGLITRAIPENYILLPFLTGTLVMFIQTFTAVINYAKSPEIGGGWVYAVIAIIFVPIAIGFIVASAEFFRGTD